MRKTIEDKKIMIKEREEEEEYKGNLKTKSYEDWLPYFRMCLTFNDWIRRGNAQLIRVNGSVLKTT